MTQKENYTKQKTVGGDPRPEFGSPRQKIHDLVMGFTTKDS